MTRARAPLLLALLLYLAAFAPRAGAAGFGPDDTLAAIAQASARYSVSYDLLDCIAYWESDGSYDPYTRGDWSPRRGRYESRGVMQIHDRGLFADFVAWGGTDRDNPYEAVSFAAWWIARYGYGPAGAGQWSVVGVYC